MQTTDVLATRRPTWHFSPSLRTRSTLLVVGYLLVLTLVAAFALWPTPIDGRLLPAGENPGDVMISHWPDILNVKRGFDETGHLPLWNPTFGAGRPVGADPLTAMWYPPSFLVHVLSLRNFFMTLMLGHLVLAGAGMLVLARRVAGIPPLPALIAAVAFELSPRMLGHLGAGHLTMIQAVAWLPWVAYGCWVVVRSPRRGAVMFTPVLAMLLLAGHPQMVFYAAMMALPWTAWLLVHRWRAGERRAVWDALLGFALASGIALLLASIHLVPLLELMANSTRQDTLRTTEGTSLWPFLQGLVGGSIQSPNPHEVLFTPGTIVLALAAIGAWHRWRTVWPVLLGIVVVASLALGNASPFYQALTFFIPGMDRFRSLGRIWFVAMIPLALLAAWGTMRLADQMRAVAPRAGRLVTPFAFVLVAMTLVWQGNTMLHADNVLANSIPTALEFRAAKLAGKHRIYGVQRNMRQVSAAEQGARLADGWDPLLLQPYVRFMQRAGGYTFSGYQLTVPPYQLYDPVYDTYVDTQPNAELLGLVDVVAVLSNTPLRDSRLERVTSIEGTTLYRNTANHGPAYLVAGTGDGAPPTIETIQHLRARVTTRERTPERFDITVSSESAGYLVIGSPFYPGWVATVDNNPAPVESIEGILPAIRVDAGQHRITFRYDPMTQRLGIVLALGGVLGMVSWVLLLWNRRRAAKPTA